MTPVSQVLKAGQYASHFSNFKQASNSTGMKGLTIDLKLAKYLSTLLNCDMGAQGEHFMIVPNAL